MCREERWYKSKKYLLGLFVFAAVQLVCVLFSCHCKPWTMTQEPPACGLELPFPHLRTLGSSASICNSVIVQYVWCYCSLPKGIYSLRKIYRGCIWWQNKTISQYHKCNVQELHCILLHHLSHFKNNLNFSREAICRLCMVHVINSHKRVCGSASSVSTGILCWGSGLHPACSLLADAAPSRTLSL